MSALLPWKGPILLVAAILAMSICRASAAPAEKATPLPPAGGLTAPPEEVWEPVPLVNPGFEDSWTGWGPKGAEVFLEYPNYRGYLPADGPQKVHLWVRVNAEKPAGPGSVEVTAADGRRIAAAPLDPARKEQTLELDAAAWSPGRYLVTAQLGAYKYPAYAVQKITADERKRIPVWFTMSDGQAVTRSLRPDSANWFSSSSAK